MLVCEYKEQKELIKGLKIYKKQRNKQRRERGKQNGIRTVLV